MQSKNAFVRSHEKPNQLKESAGLVGYMPIDKSAKTFLLGRGKRVKTKAAGTISRKDLMFGMKLITRATVFQPRKGGI